MLTGKVVKTGIKGSQDRYVVIQFTPSNAPAGYVTGGEPVDLTLVTNPQNLIGAYLTLPPNSYDVNFMDTLAGEDGEWVVGTTLKNALLKFWTSGGTEHANGNYSGAELADSINVEFIVKKAH